MKRELNVVTASVDGHWSDQNVLSSISFNQYHLHFIVFIYMVRSNRTEVNRKQFPTLFLYSTITILTSSLNMPQNVFLILYACYPSNSEMEKFLYLNLVHVTRFALEKNLH